MRLPPELLQAILIALPPAGQEPPAELLACSLTNTVLSAVSRQGPVWKKHYEARWRRIAGTSDAYLGEDYAARYRYRALQDKEAATIVVQLADGDRGRAPAFAALARLGLDVLDFLGVCMEREPEDGAYPTRWISVQYWAREARRFLLRRHAVHAWRHIHEIEDETLAFEEGILGLTSFYYPSATPPLSPFADLRDADFVRSAYDQAVRDHVPRIPTIEKAVEEHRATRAAKVAEPDVRLVARVKAVRDMIRRSLKIQSASAERYHRLQNHFVNSLIDQPTAEGTLPLVLVSVFCSLARRLPAPYQLRARPVGFPGTVLLAVALPEGEGLDESGSEPPLEQAWYYLDLYHVPKASPLAAPGREYVGKREGEVFWTYNEVAEAGKERGWRAQDFLPYSTAREMIGRAASNISLSLHNAVHFSQSSTICLYGASLCVYALYASSMAGADPDFRIARQASNRLSVTASLMQAEWPHDVSLIEELMGIFGADRPEGSGQAEPAPFEPGMDNRAIENARLLCKSIRMKDKEGPRPRRRVRVAPEPQAVEEHDDGSDDEDAVPPFNPDNPSPRYRVGHIFSHRVYSYTGIVRGWDASCRASEEWCVQQGVDLLSRGRSQPFYHVFSTSGDRYVAEENVLPRPFFGRSRNSVGPPDLNLDDDWVQDTAMTIKTMQSQHKEIGRWFARLEIDQSQLVDGVHPVRLMPSAELRSQYPDD